MKYTLFLLFMCLSCNLLKGRGNTQKKVVAIDKSSAYIEKQKPDSIYFRYHQIELDAFDCSVEQLGYCDLKGFVAHIRKELGDEVATTLLVNYSTLHKYYYSFTTWLNDEYIDVPTCEDSHLFDLELAKKQVAPLVKKLEGIIADKTNPIVEIRVSSATTQMNDIDDIVFLQRTILDKSEDCPFGHHGFLSSKYLLNQNTLGYFKSEPELKSIVGYFENTTTVLIVVPILKGDMYIANVECELLKSLIKQKK